MLVAFALYSRDQAFTLLAGNLTGTLIGAFLLGVIPNLIPPSPCYAFCPPPSSGATSLRPGLDSSDTVGPTEVDGH